MGEKYGVLGRYSRCIRRVCVGGVRGVVDGGEIWGIREVLGGGGWYQTSEGRCVSVSKGCVSV